MKKESNLAQYLYTIYLLFFITLLSFWLNPYIGYRAVGFLYLMSVIIVGFKGNFGPIIFSSISAALVWNFISIPPSYTFHISEPEDKMMLLSFVLVGILSGYLTNKTKAKERLLIEKEQKTNLLEESEKLHQILLNSVSHEMRIPLTSIIGTVNALQDLKVQTDPKKIQMLHFELTEACERLNRVIENILDMNRLNSGLLTIRKEWVEVSDLIQSVISQIKTKDHKITIVEKTPHIYLNCDERLLEHALMNLLLNAISYSPAGSLITVEIEKIEDKILIRIIDEGSGIPQDKLDLIFDKFYRLPGSPTGGIGLGLSIVKGIVEAHNGLVFASNRSDAPGSVFAIELLWSRPAKELREV